MPQEYLPIITPIGALFVAFFPLRLTYIEKQYEILVIKIQDKKKISDLALQKEIKLKNPDKEKVLTFANEIATYKHQENDISESMKNNRQQVVLDLIALASAIILGISLIDLSPINQYWQLAGIVLLMAGFFSVFGFVDKFLDIHKLKSKKWENNN